MSFHLPPLRERISDIEPLARGMAVRFARKFSKEIFDIHGEAAWPQLGIVRMARRTSASLERCRPARRSSWQMAPKILWRHLPSVVQDTPAPPSPTAALRR